MMADADVIDTSDLPISMSRPAPAAIPVGKVVDDGSTPLTEQERQLVLAPLRRAEGNQC